jgi:hypothetical protein
MHCSGGCLLLEKSKPGDAPFRGRTGIAASFLHALRGEAEESAPAGLAVHDIVSPLDAAEQILHLRH